MKYYTVIVGQSQTLDTPDTEVDCFPADGKISLFGSEHITVAEMVHRVQLHGELVSALESVIGVTLDCQQRWSRGHPDIVDRARDVLAKVKP